MQTQDALWQRVLCTGSAKEMVPSQRHGVAKEPEFFLGVAQTMVFVVFTARWCSSSQLPETVGACGCVVVDRWLRPGAWVCGSSRRVGERGVRKAASTPKGDFVPENYSCLRWVELAIMPMIQPCNQARCHRFSGVSYMQATSLR